MMQRAKVVFAGGSQGMGLATARLAAVQSADVRESILFVSRVAAAAMPGGSATAAVNGAIEAVGRVGTAEELAAAVWLLLTNGFMTGTVLPVDGEHRLAAP